MINIMVVDDSSIIRKVFSKNLEDMGHKVVAVAKDGREAIELYKKFKPDLVTMDVTMPIMNGIDSLVNIKKLFSDAKVIMVTSHGEERLVMEAITKGAKGYILKPIKVEKIEEAIAKIFPKLT